MYNKKQKAIQGTGYIHLICLFLLHFHDAFSTLFLRNIDIYHKQSYISIEACIMINKEAYLMENIYCFKGYSLHF